MWNQEDTKFLELYLGVLNYKDLSKILGKSIEAIRSKVRRNKLKPNIQKIGPLHPSWRGYGLISSRHFSKIKHRAKIDNIDFSITIDYIWNLYLNQSGKCALTGDRLVFPIKVHDSNGTASLDRIDNNKGYIFGNCQWVHKDTNFFKGEYSNQYTIEIAHKISRNNQ